MSRVLCPCGGELTFTTDRIVGYSIEICSRCGPRPLAITRPAPEPKPMTGRRNCRTGWSAAQDLTDEEMLSLLASLGARYGRTPTQDEWNNAPGVPSPYTYRRRFGSSRAAVILAGLDPRNQRETRVAIPRFKCGSAA